MKKLIVAGVMALGIFNASAQNKIGYINTDELIGSMPEAARANTELEQYKADLTQNGQDLIKELNSKDSAFVIDSLKLSPSMKEIKRNELIALYQRVQNYQQQSQDLYQQEAQKKGAPLRDKALEAIKMVAKESGYTYVLDINSIIVAPPGDDILPLVKRKLGIKDTPSQKPTTAPKVAPKKN